MAGDYRTMADFHDFEQAGWERAADHYGDAFGSLTSQTIPALLRAAGVGPGTRAARRRIRARLRRRRGGRAGRVGRGRGFLVRNGRARRAAISRSRVRWRATPKRCRFPIGRSMPSRSTSAFCISSAPDTALAEARRVFSPGGRCAFTVWATPEISVGFGIVLKAIETHGRMDVPLPPGPPFFRFSDPAESTRSMQAAGFSDVRVETVPLVWRLPSGDALFEAFANGAVRTAALLRAQSPDAMAKSTRPSRGRGGVSRSDVIELPMAAVLSSGSYVASGFSRTSGV